MVWHDMAWFAMTCYVVVCYVVVRCVILWCVRFWSGMLCYVYHVWYDVQICMYARVYVGMYGWTH